MAGRAERSLSRGSYHPYDRPVPRERGHNEHPHERPASRLEPSDRPYGDAYGRREHSGRPSDRPSEHRDHGGYPIERAAGFREYQDDRGGRELERPVERGGSNRAHTDSRNGGQRGLNDDRVGRGREQLGGRGREQQDDRVARDRGYPPDDRGGRGREYPDDRGVRESARPVQRDVSAREYSDHKAGGQPAYPDERGGRGRELHAGRGDRERARPVQRDGSERAYADHRAGGQRAYPDERGGRGREHTADRGGRERERSAERGGSQREHNAERPVWRREQDGDQSRPEGLTDDPSGALKVSSQQDPRDLARSICNACRKGDELPTLLTIGVNSVNQAVKGIAVARNDLKADGIDIAFQPAFRHSDRTRPLIAFYLTKQRPQPEELEADELTVGSNSKIIGVAGAISGRIREGHKVYLSAIGSSAVTTSVLSCANGRLFLEPDALDIKVQPEFIKIVKGETECNGLRFNFLVEPV